MIWIQFAVSALFIVAAGIRLSYYGDIIAEKTGMGRTIVGLLLISIATSLPELVTSIRAALLDNADLVLGNMLGSNLFNLTLMVILDVTVVGFTVYGKIDRKNLRTASGSLLMIMILMINMVLMLGRKPLSGSGLFYMNGTVPVIAGIGLDSILLLITFIFIIKKIVFDKQDSEEAEEELQYSEKNISTGIIGFLISAAVIVVAGIFLTESADMIAAIKVAGRPLGGTFVGSLFLAIVTSLPEMVATLGALKLKAYNMAVGNIFGSNVFNILIIFFADLFYRKGSLSAHAASGSSNILVGLVVSLITLLVVVAAKPNAPKKARLSLTSTLVLLMFIGTQLLLFVLR